MPYTPGDNWVICDLSGKKVLMSQTLKTWDGLRVHKDFWYPRHPQLDLRAIPDRPAVVDGRPRPADSFIVPTYTEGFDLIGPDGTHWRLSVEDDGALVSSVLGEERMWSSISDTFYIDRYAVTIDNDRSLYVADAGSVQGPPSWPAVSPSGFQFSITVDATLAMIVTRIS